MAMAHAAFMFMIVPSNTSILFGDFPAATFEGTGGDLIWLVVGNRKPPTSHFQTNPCEVMVYLFDVLVWCYAYTGLWMVFSEAPCSYWMWLIAFRMTAASWAKRSRMATPNKNHGLAVDETTHLRP